MRVTCGWVVAMLVGASAGPSGAEPSKVSRLRIDYEHVGFTHEQRAYVLEPAPGGGFMSGGRAIEASLVDAVSKAATENLRPSDGMSTCSSHTDDYPSFRVAVEGTHPIELFSTSNCAGNAPWSVVHEGMLFVQYGAEVAAPVYALLAAVDPKHWKTAKPPMSSGPEQLFLGSAPRDLRRSAPVGVKVAASRAAACARSTEASAAVREVLGGQVTLSQLSVGCDVEHEPACRRTEVQGSLTWRGFDLTLPFACIEDQVDAASFAAQVAAVKPFIESKVVAAWLRVASQPRTLRPHGSDVWQLRASGTAPALSYDVRARRINVVAYDKDADRPFWTALGIDPATRVYVGPAPSRTDQEAFDLAGRVIPE